MIVRKVDPKDRNQITKLMVENWGGEPLVVHAKNYFPSRMDGVVLETEEEIEGFLFYDKMDDVFEIIVFEVLKKFQGLGTFVLDEFLRLAKEEGAKKIVVMTTNDHLDALRFYQRRGFTISGIEINAVEKARKMKPAISLIGDYGIPLRDEIMLERVL